MSCQHDWVVTNLVLPSRGQTAAMEIKECSGCGTFFFVDGQGLSNWTSDFEGVIYHMARDGAWNFDEYRSTTKMKGAFAIYQKQKEEQKSEREKRKRELEMG